MYTYMHTYICIYIYTHTHNSVIYIYIYTYIHTYIHIQRETERDYVDIGVYISETISSVCVIVMYHVFGEKVFVECDSVMSHRLLFQWCILPCRVIPHDVTVSKFHLKQASKGCGNQLDRGFEHRST